MYQKKVFLPILFLCFSSCISSSFPYKTKARNYVKNYLYCSCITEGQKQFSKVDSLEMSKALMRDLVDGYYNYKWLNKILDSFAKEVIKTEIKSQYDTTKHETAYGLVTYHLSCLEFYKSKKADSIARSFDKFLTKDN